MGNLEQDKFYNDQEIGLAKALDLYMEMVLVYKLVPESQKRTIWRIEGCKNTILHLIPSKRLGCNGILDVKELNTKLDGLICFSDTQISIPYIYRWAKKNQIAFYPYIGVLESRSVNRMLKAAVDFLFQRNRKVYKNSCCFAKTPTVKSRLENMGVKEVRLLPVGLDMSLLNHDYRSSDVRYLKSKYGFEESHRVILFVGRLKAEKEPVKMVEIFSELSRKNQDYRLFMVGMGELKSAVIERAKKLEVFHKIHMIDRIANSSMWELYCLADYFVNLNCHEIFGMAILEAMYYECRVIAWKAPGPEFIIQSGVTGYLVESSQEVVKTILQNKILQGDMHSEISERFAWDRTVKPLLSALERV